MKKRTTLSIWRLSNFANDYTSRHKTKSEREAEKKIIHDFLVYVTDNRDKEMEAGPTGTWMKVHSV
jgi:hypothetical protein